MVYAAIDAGKSDKKLKPKPEYITTIKLDGGDSVALNGFHVEGDTLIGEAADHSEVRIPTREITGVRKVAKREDRRKRLQKTAKHVGLFTAFMSVGMLIGAGTGYSIPLTGHSHSSISGIDQFTSMMFGMVVGASMGIVFYMILLRDEN